MNVVEQIISLERSALDRWIRADPDGYLSLYTKDATYFDPFRDKRRDGLDDLTAQVGSIRGVKLPFTEPRYDMINPRVQLEGNVAVLSFNLVNYGKPTGSTEEAVPRPLERDAGVQAGKRGLANLPHALVFHAGTTHSCSRQMSERLINSRASVVTSCALILIAFCANAASSQGSRPIPLRVDPRAPIAAARLRPLTIFDSAYHRPRQIWIYTPRDYDARRAQAYPLIVAFDGVEYRDTMPLPLILDTLTARGRIPPCVAVLIDNGEGGVRIADLGNAAKMVQFLERQLMPFMRSNYRVATDAHRVIVTGSSAGGLAAAFVAFERSDLFGNVLSQSGAFWRGAEASNAAPYEWLTAQIAAAPKKDVRFFLDVGELEDHATLGGSGPNFRDANRRLRDALKARGYEFTYTEVPNGQHAPAYWMTRLPVGIQTLASSWR